MDSETNEAVTTVLESATSEWVQSVEPSTANLDLKSLLGHAVEYSKGYPLKAFLGCCSKVALDLGNESEVSEEIQHPVQVLEDQIFERMFELDYNRCPHDDETRNKFLITLQAIAERLNGLGLIGGELLTEVARYQVMGPTSSKPASAERLVWPLAPSDTNIREID